MQNNLNSYPSLGTQPKPHLSVVKQHIVQHIPYPTLALFYLAAGIKTMVNEQSECVSQMAPYSLYSGLLLTKSPWALVKSSAPQYTVNSVPFWMQSVYSQHVWFISGCVGFI